MKNTLTAVALAGMLATGLAGCNSTSGSSSPQASAATPAAPQMTAKREQLTQAEVVALYTGKTARGSGHSTTYKADGTWVNNSGATGKWSVTSDGTLVMTGGMNLRLQIFREGNRFYHRNAVSGAGGYYML